MLWIFCCCFGVCPNCGWPLLLMHVRCNHLPIKWRCASSETENLSLFFGLTPRFGPPDNRNVVSIVMIGFMVAFLFFYLSFTLTFVHTNTAFNEPSSSRIHVDNHCNCSFKFYDIDKQKSDRIIVKHSHFDPINRQCNSYTTALKILNRNKCILLSTFIRFVQNREMAIKWGIILSLSFSLAYRIQATAIYLALFRINLNRFNYIRRDGHKAKAKINKFYSNLIQSTSWCIYQAYIYFWYIYSSFFRIEH